MISMEFLLDLWNCLYIILILTLASISYIPVYLKLKEKEKKRKTEFAILLSHNINGRHSMKMKGGKIYIVLYSVLYAKMLWLLYSHRYNSLLMCWCITNGHLLFVMGALIL